MVAVVTQSYAVAVTSALRYLNRVVQTYNAHQTSALARLVSADTKRESPEDSRRALAENIRSYLREIGELAQQEAHLLHLELEKIGENFESADDQGGTPPPYKRHWKAKP
jgi:hypothetical protein